MTVMSYLGHIQGECPNKKLAYNGGLHNVIIIMDNTVGSRSDACRDLTP